MSIASFLRTKGRQPPMIFQAEAAECGLACLAMIAAYHGHVTDIASLRRRFSVSMKGMTLKTVVAMAQDLGLAGRALRLEPERLKDIQAPAILHWSMNHFVVLVRADGKNVWILDPASGDRRYSMAAASQHFTGVALELTPMPSFERKEMRSRLPLRQLIGEVPTGARSLAQTLLLSLLLQLLVLAAPFYLQLVVDEGVARGDAALMGALAIGFAFLGLLRFAADWLRALVLVHFSSLLNFRIGANLFHHLLRLPLEWFEKRHVGDLISRFGSTLPIRSFVAEGAVAAAADGVMAVLTLAMMILYAPLLAAVVLGGFLAVGSLRLATFRLLRRREEDAIAALAREQSLFVESARSIQTLKLFGKEGDRERLWQNRHAAVIAERGRLGKVQALLRGLTDLIQGLELVLVVYLAARSAVGGAFTVGMIFAFVAYRQQFVDKASRLIDAGIQFRMLDLHLDRIGDIALADPEDDLHAGGLVPHDIAGGLEARDLTYRYAPTEAPVLDRISFQVAPGEFVAIAGPSGEGKTTLLKLMLGLLKPEGGDVLVDGVPLARLGARAFRERVGAVMQDDDLLSGSVADNICMFDPELDIDWMRSCARTAGIDAEIMAMPMNYNMLVGDMGAALSGGQRQRILLARALYRKPAILFMDEGTSHLDIEKEQEVNAALAALAVTRIVIAHRPETIHAADRVLHLRQGRIVEAAG